MPPQQPSFTPPTIHNMQEGREIKKSLATAFRRAVWETELKLILWQKNSILQLQPYSSCAYEGGI